MRYWSDEATAVIRREDLGTTHLVGAEALAVIQVAVERPWGLFLSDFAQGLGIEEDAEVRASLQGIIDGLLQSGLLCRVDDDADPVPDRPS